MIFYISEKRPELLDAVCDKLYLAVTKIQDTYVKNLIISNMGAFVYATRLVIDLLSVKDSSNEIIEAINAFRSVNGSARIIVIADGETPGSRLLSRLINIGVYNILMDIDEESLKNSLTIGYSRAEIEARCLPLPAPDDELTNQPAPVEELRPAPASMEIISANRDFKTHKPHVTIAICSAEAHVGATHQALLMAKFLANVGFKTCYLEANMRRSIIHLSRVYPVNVNEHNRLIQFEGVDMYFDINMREALSMGYDFYIFDLGRLEEMDVQSFVSKDIRFVVGGTKAWEVPSFNHALGIPGAERSFCFILNFTPPQEKIMINKMMRPIKAYFSEYIPYPFENNVNVKIYKEIFGQYLNISKSKIHH